MTAPTLSLRPAALGLLAAALLSNCDSQRSATETADPNPTASSAVPAPNESFRKELSRGDYNFAVRTLGTGTQRQLLLEAKRLGRELMASTTNIEGVVTDAVVTNLNNDDYPELLVFVNAAGSGSYGRLVGYEFLNRGRRNLALPALDGPAAVGYLGHDSFRVEDRKIIRTFPVYLPTDPNSSPSGGTRVVEYEMPKKEGLLTMVTHRTLP
ncbi:hypothetical protein [Solirubrum puertoriconensis]|uniref:Uncharacterized protein n=1 Tax=Solirubrum puertoriconensis TaxID=1751427 RepID=A0A9X0L4G2_SOLP1|nr:hypothetical protein [Solirubrum puertoriconensis]KUG07570.1 hypothetical protein ASU33_14640 [Solirubrum puertoriconensis]